MGEDSMRRVGVWAGVAAAVLAAVGRTAGTAGAGAEPRFPGGVAPGGGPGAAGRPAAVGYTALRRSRDENDTHPDGGGCLGPLIPGVDHAVEPRDQVFIAAVKTVLDGGCPGTYADLPTD